MVPLLGASSKNNGLWYLLKSNGFTRMDMGMASAESVVLFIMIMIVTGIQFKLQDKWVNYD